MRKLRDWMIRFPAIANCASMVFTEMCIEYHCAISLYFNPSSLTILKMTRHFGGRFSIAVSICFNTSLDTISSSGLLSVPETCCGTKVSRLKSTWGLWRVRYLMDRFLTETKGTLSDFRSPSNRMRLRQRLINVLSETISSATCVSFLQMNMQNDTGCR